MARIIVEPPGVEHLLRLIERSELVEVQGIVHRRPLKESIRAFPTCLLGRVKWQGGVIVGGARLIYEARPN